MTANLLNAFEDARNSGYSFNHFDGFDALLPDVPNPVNAIGSKVISSSFPQTPQSNIDIGLDIMRKRGFSDMHIAAILGVLQAESGANLAPGIRARAKGDTGVGIAQWTNNKEGKRHKVFWDVYGRLYDDADTYKGDITKVPFEKQLNVVLSRDR